MDLPGVEAALRRQGEAEEERKAREAFDAEFSLSFPAGFAALALEGITAYPGPMTHEMLVQTHAHWREASEHISKAAALAPDPVLELFAWSEYASHRAQTGGHLAQAANC